jgi:hypothetical protein
LNPEDIEEINSNALKNCGGEESITFDSNSTSSFEVVIVDSDDKPFRNHGTFMIDGIVILLSGSATRIFEINLFDSGENQGGN